VTGREQKQILYLDDRIENAEAGVARGWHVIHHQTPEGQHREGGRTGTADEVVEEWNGLNARAAIP